MWLASKKVKPVKNDIPFNSKIDDDDDDFDSEISSDNNNIYFYSSVTRRSIFNLNKEIKKLNNEAQIRQIKYEMPLGHINLFISSEGGSAFDIFNCIDYILSSKVPVHSYIDGYAASAATIMSVVCKKRYMKKHSIMLIHQLSTSAWGKYEELKDEMKNVDMIMNCIIDIYKQYTKIPISKLKEILKHDIWFTAEECLKHGLIDEII